MSEVPIRYRKKRRRIPLRLWLCAVCILIIAAGLFLSASPGSATQNLLSGPEILVPSPSAIPLPYSDIQLPDYVTQHLLPLNKYSRPGTALDAVNGIVIHYVGNPGTTAEQNRSYFGNLAQSGETYASSHFIIGMDGTVICAVPLDEVAYCSNSRNSDTISIECCHPDESGKFTSETYDALVTLVSWLSQLYDLEREDIIRHYDVTGKVCPKYFVEHPGEWEAFRDSIIFN